MCRAAALLLLTGCLSGCASWDEYVSKSETMKLFTFVPCFTEVSAMPEHQTYYHASYFEPPRDPGGWAFVGYQVSGGKHAAVYLSYVGYVGLQRYSALSTGTPPAWKENPRCASLLVVPWSEHIKRPFYIAHEPEKLIAWAQFQATRTLVFSFAVLGMLFLVWLLLVLPGCLMDGHGSGLGLLGGLSALTFVNGIVWVCLVGEPARSIEQALLYYRFFDALPRSGSALLPLSWSQTYTLIGGPPYPPVTFVGAPDEYLWVLFSCAGLWLLCGSFRMFCTLYYCFAPDPMRNLEQGARVPPSYDDVLKTLLQAGAHLSDAQLQQLKRDLRERLPHGQ